MMKFAFWASLVVITAGLYGCHTVSGFGQDMQQGGQALQKAANDNSNDPNSTSTNQ